MTDRSEIASKAAAGLREFAAKIDSVDVLIGFDGMADSIISVVDKRSSPDDYEPIEKMSKFGEKILAAAGKSSNYELVVTHEKLGGNGPIMANAMTIMGLPVRYIGGIGYPEVHSAFREFAERCVECLPLADPGYTDAYEFNDGKLIMGKLGNTRLINKARLQEIVGEKKLIEVVRRSKLIGMLNWTMLLNTNEIWEYMIDDIFPRIDWPNGEPARIFVDLTDPEKRTKDDLREALRLIGCMQKFTGVTLGMNLKESGQVAGALGIEVGEKLEDAVCETAKSIVREMGISGVVIHPLGSAVGAKVVDGGGVEVAEFDGPFVKVPRLSTGAGDNFNAGYCLGELAGLSVVEALCVGTATSGYYVRNAGSPTLEQLADFCDALPEAESGGAFVVLV